MNRTITLSFDNGPTTAVTPHVLDVLARHGIRSTFFVLGKHLEDADTRAVARDAARAGHWIGNHTYTHSVPLGEMMDPKTPEHEIGRTQRLIADLSHADKLFRPFGGGGKLGPHLLSPAAYDYLRDNAFTCVLWNSIPRDWDDADGWVETALAQARAGDWTLTVLHDYETGAMRHLDRFIQGALDEGFTFRQEFPADCLPMVRGVVRDDMDHFVSKPISPASARRR
jgi:peptidoglycan/xylan/chitin deacetylase (PgdA/CDA1 family)